MRGTRPNAFKTPERKPASVDEWVEQGREAAPVAKPAKGERARLTIDLPPEVHARFKAACAMRKTRMVDEVTKFIEDWTQKNS